MDKKNLVLIVLLIILVIITCLMDGCQSFPERQAAFLESGKLPPTLSELSDLKMDKKVLQSLACNIGQCGNEWVAMRNLDVLFFYVRDSQTVWEGAQLIQISMSIESVQPSRRHPQPLNISAMAKAIAGIDEVLARRPLYKAAQKRYGVLELYSKAPYDLKKGVLDTLTLAGYIKFTK